MTFTALNTEGETLKRWDLKKTGRKKYYEKTDEPAEFDTPNGFKDAARQCTLQGGGFVVSSEPLTDGSKWKVDADGSHKPVD